MDGAAAARLGIEEAAREIGRSRRALEHWRSAGAEGFELVDGALLVDMAVLRAWAIETKRLRPDGELPKKGPAPARARARARKAPELGGEALRKAAGELAEEVTLTEAKRRKELALAEKHELQVAILRGRLVERKVMDDRELRGIEAARAVLIGIPGRLAGRLASMVDPREVEAELKDAIYSALRELAAMGSMKPAEKTEAA